MDNLSTQDAVTALLTATTAGTMTEGAVIDQLVPLVYDELRRLAHRQLARERGQVTLDTTGLVHETYLKLVDQSRIPARGRNYFFGAAARAMRQVLVDAARRRNRQKRGGGHRPQTLEETRIALEGFATEILDLEEALNHLEVEFPRQARVVEYRFFGGLTVEETAQILEISARTVKGDWALAKAWLFDRLESAS